MTYLLDTRTLTAETTSQSGGRYKHYRLADSRGLAVSGEEGRSPRVIVTVLAEHGGDYRTPRATRYFTIEKGESGWVVKEEGWERNLGGDPDGQWLKLAAAGFATRRDAVRHALRSALASRRIDR